MITRRSLLALLACSAGPTFGFAQEFRHATSNRSRAASRLAARSTPASPTSPNRRASLIPSSTAASTPDATSSKSSAAASHSSTYDNDGWLDVFILSGTRSRRRSRPGATNRLYKNNRDGTFTDVTEKAGLMRRDGRPASCVGDYDNDGFDDLFIT